mmetsp:Transcript_27903/g.66295  ORF Transcript_27903/g.66295 Transcript_27903/m.66295 type:complete len:202 (-) Transcript_27903:902-1507(-)
MGCCFSLMPSLKSSLHGRNHSQPHFTCSPYKNAHWQGSECFPKSACESGKKTQQVEISGLWVSFFHSREWMPGKEQMKVLDLLGTMLPSNSMSAPARHVVLSSRRSSSQRRPPPSSARGTTRSICSSTAINAARSSAPRSRQSWSFASSGSGSSARHSTASAASRTLVCSSSSSSRKPGTNARSHSRSSPSVMRRRASSGQ